MYTKIYFGGGSFGCVYHIGVVQALYEANKTDLTVYANSAGALIGAFYICKIPIDVMSKIFMDIATNTLLQKSATNTLLQKSKKNPGVMGLYQLTQHQLYIFDCIHSLAPDAYKKCSGRLKIGITMDVLGFQWRDTFTSNVDLFHILLCSTNVPYLCNYDAQIDGVRCIDGGFGFVMSRDLPKDTLTVTLRTSSYNSSYYTYNKENIDTNIPFFHRIMQPPKSDWERYLQNGYDDMKYRIVNKTSKPHIPPYLVDFENIIILPSIQFSLSYLQKMTNEMYDYSSLVYIFTP